MFVTNALKTSKEMKVASTVTEQRLHDTFTYIIKIIFLDEMIRFWLSKNTVIQHETLFFTAQKCPYRGFLQSLYLVMCGLNAVCAACIILL